jgi:superfamily II DNA/RNA helicase
MVPFFDTSFNALFTSTIYFPFCFGFFGFITSSIAPVPRFTGCPTMMFSATLDNDIDYLTRKYTNNAQEISVKSYIDASKLSQSYYSQIILLG